MSECLHCKGQQGWWIAWYDQSCTYDEVCERYVVEWEVCWTYQGTGTMSPLGQAVFLARGGPAPIQGKEYA